VIIFTFEAVSSSNNRVQISLRILHMVLCSAWGLLKRLFQF
jgi:hypothetical protein